MHFACAQYYIRVFPSRTAAAAGTAITKKNMLRRLCIMARTTIFNCKGDAALEACVLDLVPGIHAALDYTCPAVRLRSLEALVAAFAVLGERIAPYMASLPATQQRLVNLYLRRIQPADVVESVRAVQPVTAQ
jgi:hypothetical protein